MVRRSESSISAGSGTLQDIRDALGAMDFSHAPARALCRSTLLYRIVSLTDSSLTQDQRDDIGRGVSAMKAKAAALAVLCSGISSSAKELLKVTQFTD
jgi:hypothetical protein